MTPTITLTLFKKKKKKKKIKERNPKNILVKIWAVDELRFYKPH